MTQEQLEDRQAVIEKQFNDYDAEMKRLQGEHRLVIDLLAKLKEQETVEVKHKVAKKRLRKVN